jgi:hypothetical protein
MHVSASKSLPAGGTSCCLPAADKKEFKQKTGKENFFAGFDCKALFQR